VCIVGCGITGAALAYYLSRHHHTDADGDDGSSTEGPPLSIVVLDARTVAGGATGRNGGIMWPDTSDPFEVGGAELMREFVATHHVDCGWVASGGVSLVGDPLHPEQARAAVEGDDADLLDSVTAIDPLATLGAAPGAFTAGYKDASVVTLRAARVALALARLATDNGVTLRENCPVTDIVGGGAGEVAVVSTTIGSLQCGRVIVATNGWLPRLLPELGPHIRACTNTVMSSAKPVPPHLRWNLAAVSCGEGAKEVYCVMTEAGTLVMGGLRDSGDMWSGDDDQAPGDSRIVPLLENW
jgi:glycine/D-amino acid oxidase-like deaminating enzyme